MKFSPEQITAIAGILLSLAMNYIPGLAPWYDQLTPTPKKTLMLSLLLLATVGAIGYQCRLDGACYAAGWEDYLTAFVVAVITNQATHAITPLPAERRATRAEAAQRTLLARLRGVRR